jgi:hypothetical protein
MQASRLTFTLAWEMNSDLEVVYMKCSVADKWEKLNMIKSILLIVACVTFGALAHADDSADCKASDPCRLDAIHAIRSVAPSGVQNVYDCFTYDVKDDEISYEIILSDLPKSSDPNVTVSYDVTMSKAGCQPKGIPTKAK